MWNYEKRLEYPIKIKQNNPELAKVIISQYGGPNGEITQRSTVEISVPAFCNAV